MSELSRSSGAELGTRAGRDRGSTNGTPRWVKVTAMIFGVLALLIVIVLIVAESPFGEHGPGRHMSGNQLVEQIEPQASVGLPPGVGRNR